MNTVFKAGKEVGFEGSEAFDYKWKTLQWFALYTRSRHEKFLDSELKQKGIETFLPLRKITRRWSDRYQQIEEPLFKGYLFVRIPLMDRYQVLNTKGAVCLVGKGAEAVAVPERELDLVRRFIEEEIPVDPFPYLKEGERVYVRSGPFKGAEGFILRKDRHCRLVISLDLLMQSISIEIDQANVEPI